MKNYIVKFVPKDESQKQVIHKIKMPDCDEKGFYRQSISFGAFRNGHRKNATKKEKESYRAGCVWAPSGLYYTNEFVEEDWLKWNAERVERLKKYNIDIDETKLEVVEHENLFAFYDYIGFDRKKRIYRS